VGNGQYYDPATGRFLTRDVYPNNTNPYVPWNPLGTILGPLALVSLFYARKRKGSKTGTFLVLLIVLGGVGLTLAACGAPAGPVTATVVSTPGAPVTYTATFADGTTIAGTLPASSGAATVIATSCATIPPTPSPTGTPIPTSTPTPTIYNGEVITGWGCVANDDACRSDRAKRVWDWIKNSNTWWGDHREPDPKDLATWLLEHEGGPLRNDQTKSYGPNGYKWLQGIHVMVGRFSQLFGDGNITPLDLSTFTAFFNPNRGDSFDSDDWRQLTTKPPSFWRTDVDEYWAEGVVYDDKGNQITRWWDNKADVASGYCSTGCNVAFSVYIPLGDYTLFFGY
jgi:hypothetical protein